MLSFLLLVANSYYNVLVFFHESYYCLMVSITYCASTWKNIHSYSTQHYFYPQLTKD